MFLDNTHSKVHRIFYSEIADKNVEIYLKREDLLHPFVSGNKYRKLKYNLQEAESKGYSTLLTFGGAYSNHIAATAYAGRQFGFKTIGVIRGEELATKVANSESLNPTLQFAEENGMELDFVSREEYRNKHTQEFKDFCKKKFGEFYLIPEGGTNELAVKGCEEILDENSEGYDYICVSVGTGGTIAGLINTAKKQQKVLGFAAVNDESIVNKINRYTKNSKNWKLFMEDFFGGYGKTTDELVRFINQFKAETNIALDPIYTGKMIYRIIDQIKSNHFSVNSKILAIHTGGLQGVKGMNQLLEKKKKTLINS